MAKIIIPTPLRKFTADQSTVEAAGHTVGEVIRGLSRQHRELGKHLLDDNDNIRSFIRIYVGEEDINDLNKEATPIDEKTVISIVPAIAGG